LHTGAREITESHQRLAPAVCNISGDSNFPADRDKFYLSPEGTGNYTGSFASLSLPPLGSDSVWNANQLSIDGRMSIIKSPVLTSIYTPPGAG
jgi:hypothetical protein